MKKCTTKLVLAGFLLSVIVAGTVWNARSLQANALTDISGHKYEKMIEFLESEKIVGGYTDGTFQPDKPVVRVEFLKVVLESTRDFIPEVNDDCGFDDVDPSGWYAKYVCLGKTLGIVNGYSDGSFKPDKTVSFVEASKIAELGYDYDVEPADTDAGEGWFAPYVSIASDRLFIPPDVGDLNELLSRGQISEFLGRFVKYEDDVLEDYFDDVSMDYVLFDPTGVVLETFKKSVINAVDFMAGTQVVDFSSGNSSSGGSGSSGGSSGGDIPAVIDGDWLSLDAGDTEVHKIEEDGFTLTYQRSEIDPDIMVGSVSAIGDDDSKLDIAFTEDKVETNLEYFNGSSSMLVSSIVNEGLPASGAVFDEVEDIDYTQSFVLTDGVSGFGMSHSYLDGVEAFEHLIGVDSPGATYQLGVTNDSYTEAVHVEGDGLDFLFEGGMDGGSENWSYADSDSLISISQIVGDDDFHEQFTFGPVDGALINLVMDDDGMDETFIFDDTGFDLDVTMSENDYTEVMTYEEDGLYADVTIADIGTTDMSLLIGDEYDQLFFDIVDNSLQELTYVVTEDDDTVVVSLTICEELGPTVSGLLYDAEGGVTDLFYDNALVAQDLSIAGEKITLTDQLFSLANSIGTLSAPITLNSETDEKEMGDIDLSWDSAVNRAISNGSFGIGDNLLKKFNVNLDLGDDEDDVNEHDAADDSWKWYKKNHMSLGGSSILTGGQDGKVKGHGVDKEWNITLSPTEAEAEQEANFKRGALEKDFKATVRADFYDINQKLDLGGKFGGTYVGKKNSTSLINGVLSGSQNFELDGSKFKKNLSGTYGTNVPFGFTQKNRIKLSGLGIGSGDAEVNVDVSKKGGDDPEITVGLTTPVGKVGGIDVGVDIGATFGGGDEDGGSGSKARPGISLTGSRETSSGARWGLNLGVEKGPGDSKPRFTFGFGWSF